MRTMKKVKRMTNGMARKMRRMVKKAKKMF